MPKAEVLLWSVLRGKQVAGRKFRRQYGIGAYIIDFYCPSARLAIEVDGDSHVQAEVGEYDRRRQAFIESLGIRVVRVTNLAVYENLEAVVSAISLALGEPPVVPLRKGDTGEETQGKEEADAGGLTKTRVDPVPLLTKEGIGEVA
jgi:very-short-patch-repair endonuclease